MADIPIKTLREYYYSRIDEKDLGSKDDVDRLIDLINMHRKLRREVHKTGVLTITENGSQSFTKTNDGIVKMNDLNKTIKDLKKSIQWKSIDNHSQVTSKITSKNKNNLRNLIDD
ncbi:hypothetical protein [Facklamia sp. P12950]|uniref:hypothetical protein n=1 Tax=Facklamia sp. P12950 TaxID=3421951 RepID=UPI003D170F25